MTIALGRVWGGVSPILLKLKSEPVETNFPHPSLNGKIEAMVPSKLGRYLIKSELGRGGMATVYHAFDPHFRREVALKVLPREFLHDPTFRTRFEREAHTVATLEHPAIVPVYDVGEEDGQPYLVMRYLTGGSLTDRLLKDGTLSYAETTRLINHLAPALDEAHARGIIHRDLKPDNILFDQRHDPYITDFGIAKLTEASGALTTSTTIIGTPAYLSPEQAHGEVELDGRSDVYAMGVMAFQMLTGRLPFQSHTPIGLIMKHLTETAPSILEIKADLPPGCEAVIAQALAKERDERYPTATALGSALVEAVRAKPADSADAPVKTLKLSELKSARLTPGPATPAGVDPIVCPKCQHANAGSARLCAMCGQRLKIECVQCYTANPLDATHCSNCGTDLVRTRALRHQYQQVRQRTITERGLAAKEKEARQLRERIDALLAGVEDRRQRVRAYDQLNKLDDRAMKLLTDLMLQNPETATRTGLAATLGRICAKPKIRALIKSQAVKALIKALEDTEPEVRSQAAAALGGVSGQLGQLAVEPLGDLLKDSNETVRTQARQALQTIGGKKAQDILDSPKGLMGWIKGI